MSPLPVSRWEKNRGRYERESAEMLKIMAVCDTHKVGIVPHFTGPIATAGHMHAMMAFPGQVLMEYNQGERPVPYMPEFLECRTARYGRTIGLGWASASTKPSSPSSKR